MTDSKDICRTGQPQPASDRPARCKPCGGTGAADIFAIEPCDACGGAGRPGPAPPRHAPPAGP